MAARKFQVGDVVSVKEREEAYGSGYAGQAECFLEPGEIGIVAAINVPYVTGNRAYFHCVDFFKEGVYPGWGKNDDDPWRTSVHPDNLVFLG